METEKKNWKKKKEKGKIKVNRINRIEDKKQKETNK